MHWSVIMTNLDHIDQTAEKTRLSSLEALHIRGLTVSYPKAEGSVTPIRDLSLTINRGEIVGLIGDTATGKSSLALAMLGLVRSPGKIISGSVVVDGRDLLSLPTEEARKIRGRDLAIIVQNPRSALNPMLRIGQQIGYALQAHDPDFSPGVMPRRALKKALHERSVELLRQVGINDPDMRINSYVHELSGGMAQRALIAMALAARPKYLVADEPTSGLDVTIQAQFLDQLWRTVRQQGASVLLIAKELGVIANYCDRVAVLHEGRIADEQPVHEFFAHPRHEYSRSILALQKSKGLARHESVDHEAIPIIQALSVVKHFPIRNSRKVVNAVNDVSLDIRKGETLGLVGESGSGKSSVGRCLLQLIELTDGKVFFEGKDLAELSRQQLRKARARLQIVLQDPFDSFDPSQSVVQAVEEPLKLHTKLGRAERRDRVKELLALVGLSADILDIKPHGLGVGSMQRLSIARALATNPQFIVLDEPTSVLSPRAIVELIELLEKVQKTLGVSFLFISHDLTTVSYLCHRVAVMYLGQIVEIGSVEQVFRSALHPYSRALLSAHLAPDPRERRVAREVAGELLGEIPSPIDLPSGCSLVSRCPHVEDRCRREAQLLTRLPDGRFVRCWKAIADIAGNGI
jgi:oligopeptide/dipeptide ABC transporter ATP-binding protein